jgi:hypothetical protein
VREIQWCTAVTPVLRRLRQKDDFETSLSFSGIEASLVYKPRSCLKNKIITKNKGWGHHSSGRASDQNVGEQSSGL